LVMASGKISDRMYLAIAEAHIFATIAGSL